MHVLSSTTTIEPLPQMAPLSASAVGVYSVSSSDAGQEAAGGAADEDRLELAALAGAGAAGQIEQASKGHAQRHLDDPRLIDGTGDLDERRSGVAVVADLRECRRAIGHDPRHQRERLHVVDHRRPSPQALGRRVGRALIGLGALVLDGPHERRLFADDETARYPDDLDVDVEACAERVRPQVAGLFEQRARRR